MDTDKAQEYWLLTAEVRPNREHIFVLINNPCTNPLCVNYIEEDRVERERRERERERERAVNDMPNHSYVLIFPICPYMDI